MVQRPSLRHALASGRYSHAILEEYKHLFLHTASCVSRFSMKALHAENRVRLSPYVSHITENIHTTGLAQKVEGV
jgi:hypothetical protein